MFTAHTAEVSQDLKSNILDCLNFISWRESARKDSVVFVKPNFTFPRYSQGVTTSPELLRCLLEIVKGRSSAVIVGESDGGNRSFKAEEAFKGHRMYKICKEVGVDLVNLSTLPSKFVQSEIQSRKVKVKLPKLILEKVDCFISVPVLKVHVITGVSLGLKNLWGCYPDTMRCLHHQNLERKLALMAKLLNPKITVIDGLFALNGHGPMFGEPVKMNLLLGSNNVVVADTLGAMTMGVPLEKAKHILMAAKEGIGTTNLESVKINTDWTQFARKFHIRKTLLDRASSILFHSHIAAKLVMDSPFTSLVYKVGSVLRSPEEKSVASEIGLHKHY